MIATKKVREMSPDERKVYVRALYAANPDAHKRRKLRWQRRKAQAYALHPEEFCLLGKADRARVKFIVLSHYGPAHTLRCAWPECGVCDIDLLTLDHVNNDGAQDVRKSATLYRHLIRNGFPEGFQTLCWNHQWKKELMHRRGA